MIIALLEIQLALVHMSDHYTRIRTGGSPLPLDAPVVGILFGHHNDQDSPSIVDAEDIPLDDPTPAVELHQAVFPNNVVMGCYRVTAQESSPTADDIRQVQSLQQTLATTSSDTYYYFGLLHVSPKVGDEKKQDDTLPLQLFTLQDSVLVAVEDWHLTTEAAAERIAVERVLRDKPVNDNEDQTKQAWQALDTRLQQVEEYLQTTLTTTTSEPTSEQLELWRQVQGLLVQANLLRTASTGSSGNHGTMLPQQVAVLAKTVDAIAWYTDKFRMVHEVKGTSAAAASLREARRF